MRDLYLSGDEDLGSVDEGAEPVATPPATEAADSEEAEEV